MPFTQVDDNPTTKPDPYIARLLATAAHPSNQRRPIDFDLRSPYREMEAPKGAVWPRASIRPMPLMRGKDHWWAVRLWDAPGRCTLTEKGPGELVPAGLWVSANFATLPEAMDWAAAEVEKRRPKAYASGPWGAAC